MTMVLQILEITALAILLVLLVVYAIYQSVPRRIGFIPLPKRAVKSVIEALAISDTVTLTMVDLGCGDGRILAAALNQHLKLKGLGVEINPLVAWLARWRLHNLRDRVHIVRGDLFKTDFTKTTRVFTYLN